MRAGDWHSFSQTFIHEQTLHDGERLFASTHQFENGRLHGSAIRDVFQFALRGVEPASVDHLPHMAELAPALIRENLVPLRDAVFPFQLLVRMNGEQYRSAGLVCAELMLRSLAHRAAAPADKLKEVEEAFERGLLDEMLHGRADFRLRIRPAIEEFHALRDSGYVPGFRVNVLFSTWKHEKTGEWVVPPMAAAYDFDLMFEPQSRDRGFRMTDLFTADSH